MASNKQIKASVILGGSITGAFKSSLKSAETGLKQIGAQIDKLNRKQALLGDSIKSMDKLGLSADRLRAGYAAAAREVDRLRRAQSRLSTAAAAEQANLDRRANLRGKLGGAVGMAFALALPVGSVSRQTAAFDKEMRLIGNTADMTQADVDALGRTVLRLSSRVGQSAQNVQKGVGFLIAAGLDPARTTASIEAIGRTATAAGADIIDMSKAAFTLIDTLKISPDGLPHALDILAQAGKEGNFELRDMAQQLPQLGAAMMSLKMQGNEATATLGAALQIARKGAGDPDTAARNMQNFLAKILSPETLNKAKKKFNLDLYGIIQREQRTGGNPFEASIEAIMRATGGDAKKLGDLFQDMQVQNFLRPIMQNWDEYRRIKEKALNATGVTDRDFANVMATQQQQFDNFRNSAGRLAITLGHALAPSVGDAAGKLSGLMDRVTAFVDKHPQLVGGAIKAAVAFTGLRLAVIALGYAFTFVAAPFLRLRTMIAEMRAASLVGEATTGVGRLGIALRGAFVGVAALGWPLVAIIGAVAVGAVLVRKYWEPIKAWFSGFAMGLMDTVGPAFTALGTALAPLKPIWDGIAEVAGKVWGWFTKLIEPVHMTGEQIGKATESGRVFGEIVGNAISLVIGLVAKLIGGFMRVASWGMRIGNAIGGWFGIGGNSGAQAPAAAATAPRMPPPPPSIAKGGGNTSSTDARQFSFTVHQQPGESADALTSRIMQRFREQQGVDMRGALYDGAGY